MKEYINCGVYEVDLKGSTAASFTGPHPSIIIQKLTEPTIYFVIPLTTYSKDKWEKLRKFGCCKIDSTCSIARIDKIEVRETIDIPKRYVQQGKFIIPSDVEINNVLEKTKLYLKLSLDKASRSYQKFYNENTLFDTEWNNYLATQSVAGTHFAVVSDNPLVLSYPKNIIKSLTFEDIVNVLKNSIFYFKIEYNNGDDIEIKLSKKP